MAVLMCRSDITGWGTSLGVGKIGKVIHEETPVQVSDGSNAKAYKEARCVLVDCCRPGEKYRWPAKDLICLGPWSNTR